MTNREQLEKDLVRRPFDAALRRQYADVLAASGDWTTALEQYELLAGAQPDQAYPLVGLARSRAALGQPKEAVEAYLRAHNLGGFESDAALEALAAEARPVAPRLRAVDGGRGSNVLPFVIERDGRVGFADVAGMDDLKSTLRLQIIEPFRRPALFARFRKQAGGGVLLYGPPGCGKTMMARAIATECGAQFVSVGISDILNLWIGESERNLANLFRNARENKPCVLFFDELDALAFSRSKANSEHSRTVVNEFLAQLDGFDHDNAGVLILAATNMPWDVDPAMKRPGRFARQVFVPPPDQLARAMMFRQKVADIPTGDLTVDALAAATALCSGADIDGIVDLAKERVLADIITSGNERPLSQADLQHACDAVTPSTLDWLRTARNLVRYGGEGSYKDIEKYLKTVKLP
jgi:SpoVK/Ycf46/Vps4 family AAA+-type ATPase